MMSRNGSIMCANLVFTKRTRNHKFFKRFLVLFFYNIIYLQAITHRRCNNHIEAPWTSRIRNVKLMKPFENIKNEVIKKAVNFDGEMEIEKTRPPPR